MGTAPRLTGAPPRQTASTTPACCRPGSALRVERRRCCAAPLGLPQPDWKEGPPLVRTPPYAPAWLTEQAIHGPREPHRCFVAQESHPQEEHDKAARRAAEARETVMGIAQQRLVEQIDTIGGTSEV